MTREYDRPKMMQNLERAFKDSKLWRWMADFTYDHKPTKTMATDYAKATVNMWNDDGYKDGWEKVNPTAHDMKVFANYIYQTFLKMYQTGNIVD